MITIDVDGKIVFKGEVEKFIQIRKDRKIIYAKNMIIVSKRVGYEE